MLLKKIKNKFKKNKLGDEITVKSSIGEKINVVLHSNAIHINKEFMGEYSIIDNLPETDLQVRKWRNKRNEYIDLSEEGEKHLTYYTTYKKKYIKLGIKIGSDMIPLQITDLVYKYLDKLD